MSSSNHIWLDDEKLPVEIVAYHVHCLFTDHRNNGGPHTKEVNIRIDFAYETSEDRCLEILNGCLKNPKGFKVKSKESALSQQLSPRSIVCRIVYAREET
jgi:hypothetical protein